VVLAPLKSNPPPKDPNMVGNLLPACSERVAKIIEQYNTRVAEIARGVTMPGLPKPSAVHFCNVPQCPRTKPFSSQSRRKDHERAVHHFKKFHCSCGSVFAHRCEQTRHLKRVNASKRGCSPRDPHPSQRQDQMCDPEIVQCG
jgi:hypothetical protein